MEPSLPEPAERRAEESRRSRATWIVVGCCLVIALAVLLRLQRGSHSDAGSATSAARPADAGDEGAERDGQFTRLSRRRGSSEPALSAEQVVSNKVAQFARSRREILEGMARKLKVAVPDDVKRFFDAAEVGRWDEIDLIFKSLTEQRKSETGGVELAKLWPAIIDTYGAAEQAHLWPAQKLLDYGHAVLDALRPGMVYVGGTDGGRWIPELLNDTSDGERHIIVTQNAFADGTYLEYVRTLYGDRMVTPTSEESQRAFQDYLADAQKRFQHDQQFPDEPKQVRPGEDIKVNDNRVQVSGQTAVMAINERLLQILMQNNPELSFALQESFPLRSTYGDAAPLGPIMELRVQDAQNAFTAERAAQSLEYWRATAQQLMGDPEAAGSPETLKAYSKLAVGQANLFGDRNYSTEAEQAYRLASEIWPGNVEAVGGLSGLLANSGRVDEARRLLDEFERKYPDMKADAERARALWKFTTTTPAKP